MKDYTKWEIPLYIDCVNKEKEKEKDKTFENMFAAWPLRVLIINKDLKIEWILHPSEKDGSFDFNQIKDKLGELVAQKKN